MRESMIETYLVKQVKKAGGVAEKFYSRSKKGLPDRVVSWPRSRVDWVELKAPGEKPSAAQRRDHKRREAMGHEVWVIDSKGAVDQYVDFCKGRDKLLARRNFYDFKYEQ